MDGRPEETASRAASPSCGGGSRFPIYPPAMLACVMATVPANELIRRTIKSREDDPRMPAILEDDAWSTWLGEGDATPAAAKAVLKTMEGVNWQTAPEPKTPRPRKP